MKCIKCGREIKAGSAFCQYCGVPQPKKNSAQNEDNRENKKSLNKMCVIGLVAAVLTSFFNIGELGGLIAVGLSVYGLMQCKKMNEGGRVLAVIGIVIGIFTIMDASAQREFNSLMYWLF